MTEILDNEPSNSRPPLNGNRILQINAIIFAVYTLISLGSGKEAFFIAQAICIVIHVALCFLIGIIVGFTSKKEMTKYHFLSAGLVLLIGFGSCIGLAGLME